jgi:hypothetical protein
MLAPPNGIGFRVDTWIDHGRQFEDLHRGRVPPGNLHAVAAELHEMTKVTKELNEIIRSASLEPA